MAQHKPTDDPIARTLVENRLAELIRGADVGAGEQTASDLARLMIGAFPFVEMDTVRSNLPGGQKIYLRRPVLTGEFEVDPNAVTRGE